MEAYLETQKNLASGWNTWNSRSVLSHVLLPEGFAINLALKEYEDGRYLKEALIGRFGEEDERVTPGGHAYDGSFTELMVNWRKISTLQEVNETRIKPAPMDLYLLNRKVMEQDTVEEIQVLFQDLFRQFADTSREEKDTGRSEIIIETIKEIVGANYADLNLNLQGISSMLKMSSVYVGRLFKKGEMISVAEYINEVRLNHAVYYLESGDMNVNDIMEKVGFSNQSHFFRLFKKKFGTTPREYRMKKILT
jgi:AraC-like DNA-binding protein